LLRYDEFFAISPLPVFSAFFYFRQTPLTPPPLKMRRFRRRFRCQPSPFSPLFSLPPDILQLRHFQLAFAAAFDFLPYFFDAAIARLTLLPLLPLSIIISTPSARLPFTVHHPHDTTAHATIIQTIFTDTRLTFRTETNNRHPSP